MKDETLTVLILIIVLLAAEISYLMKPVFTTFNEINQTGTLGTGTIDTLRVSERAMEQ